MVVWSQDPYVRVGAASVIGTRVKCSGCIIGSIIFGCIFMCRFIALIWKAVSIAVTVRMHTLSKTEIGKVCENGHSLTAKETEISMLEKYIVLTMQSME